MENKHAPAFPQAIVKDTEGCIATYDVTSEYAGITKREYFAAMALQGILTGKITAYSEFHAKTALEYADKLLEELGK